MQRIFAPLLAATLAFSSLPSFAQDTQSGKVDALFDALGLPEMLMIMRDEGIGYGETLATDMFPGGGDGRWNAAVTQIYDADMMREEVMGALDEALEGDDIDAMLDFYLSAQGTKIVNLEVSARRALLDEAVEAASKDNAAIAIADETDRYQQVTEFIEANDLIESNVVGSLNSNYAFYMGLIDGGAMPPGVTADSALQDVWSQEADIRASTEEWVYAFLLMAYQPLSDAEMEAYITFSKSDAGKEINTALFTAFNGMFDDISRALGLAASRFMISQEL